MSVFCVLITLLDSSLPTWEPIPLITSEQRARGFRGGEGGQWPRTIAVSPTEPNFVLLGIDVGGMYRSFDSGASWEPCNVGYTPRGSAFLVVDPHNSKRILSVGMSSGPGPHHGIWLSEDQAASWKPAWQANIANSNDIRDHIAFDPSTYDPAQKLTRIAYYSRTAFDEEAWGLKPENKPLMYLSKDGGRSWKELPGTEKQGGCWVRVLPQGGRVFAGGRSGLYVSDDQGKTFQIALPGEVTGLDTVLTRPKSLWVTQPDRLLVSHDGGRTFQSLASLPERNGKERFVGMRASPAEPTRLTLYRHDPGGWNWPRFTSQDGGKSWQEAKKGTDGDFLPNNTRQHIAAWHPTNPAIAYSIGGDWPTKSTDGGLSFGYSSTGFSGLLVGGKFNFSPHSPNTVFFASQDYDGAVTQDLGRTWMRTKISGQDWGGFCYGGVAVTKTFLAAGDAPGWGGPRTLSVSQDGGRSWSKTSIVLNSSDTSLAWSRDPKVALVFDYRTEDGGKSWRKMEGCDGVYSEQGGRIFGFKEKDVVVSKDGGRSWSKLFTAPGDVLDVAAAPGEGPVYAASGLRLLKWDGGKLQTLETPGDEGFGYAIRTVAVDPKYHNVVYAGSAGNYYSSQHAVIRSEDGGRTWKTMTLLAPLTKGVKDGGRETHTLRVHPVTREVWAATSCFGTWKLPAYQPPKS